MFHVRSEEQRNLLMIINKFMKLMGSIQNECKTFFRNFLRLEN
jgi:hypothetical protein